MLRTEVFKNTDENAKGREYVALLQAIESGPKGKAAVSSCMYFFGSSQIEVECRVSNFLAAEREKAARAEAAREALSERRKRATHG